MSISSVCVVIRRSPYGREDAFAGLRMALSGLTHGLRFTVVMCDDGVWNAVRGQRSEAIGMPSNEEVISDILMFEGKIHVDEDSLKGHGLTPEDLVEGVEVVPCDGLAELVLGHDAVMPLCGGF